MLLRISLSDGEIDTVVSTSPGEVSKDIPDIAGCSITDLLSTWPLSEEFRMVLFTPGSAIFSAAARMDTESSVLVYYLDADDHDLYNPSIPAIRLIPDRNLPVVSPGFVCLLGYTPWELSQSELISSLPGDSHESRGQATLLDKTGKGLRLIFSRTSNNHGGTDYTFIRRPERP